MYINYKPDGREVIIFSFLSIFMIGFSFVLYLVENDFVGFYWTVPGILFIWGCMFFISRYPNGYKVGNCIGHGNHTGEPYEIDMDYFKKGAGRKERGKSIRIHLPTYTSPTIMIQHGEMCRVYITEKIKPNHYEGRVIIYSEDLEFERIVESDFEHDKKLIDLQDMCFINYKFLLDRFCIKDVSFELSYRNFLLRLSLEELEDELEGYRCIYIHLIVSILQYQASRTDNSVVDICNTLSGILGKVS